MILCAGGDPGGSRAVQPVAAELLRRGVTVRILKYGFLGKEWPDSISSLSLPSSTSPCRTTCTVCGSSSRYERTGKGIIHTSAALCPPDAAESLLAACTAFVFGSSATDAFPLALARRAKALGKPVVHVLDNWSSYCRRLQTDGGPLLEPDIYAVMDETARQGALAEGIPESCLLVTGHPAFAEFSEELRMLSRCERRMAANRLNLPADKLNLAFVSEPFRQVFGENTCAPDHPGFTTERVLASFAMALAPYAGRIHLAILPHPKQNAVEVGKLWERVRGNLAGGVVSLNRGRDILPALDGIAGMASILLYEAWLGGLPVLSLQPGCSVKDLQRFALLDGIEYVATEEAIPAATAAWLTRCRLGERKNARPELALHQAAPGKIADLVLQLTGVKR